MLPPDEFMVPGIQDWYVSSLIMTVWVRTHDGYIWDGAATIRKFAGEPFPKLIRWLSKKGPIRIHLLPTTQESVHVSENPRPLC